MDTLHVKALTMPTNKCGKLYVFYGMDRRGNEYELTIDSEVLGADRLASKIETGKFYIITQFSVRRTEKMCTTTVALNPGKIK